MSKRLLAFECGDDVQRLIEQEQRRLAQQPGVLPSRSAAIRRLILLGAKTTAAAEDRGG